MQPDSPSGPTPHTALAPSYAAHAATLGPTNSAGLSRGIAVISVLVSIAQATVTTVLPMFTGKASRRPNISPLSLHYNNNNPSSFQLHPLPVLAVTPCTIQAFRPSVVGTRIGLAIAVFADSQSAALRLALWLSAFCISFPSLGSTSCPFPHHIPIPSPASL
ncbi:hypothetical protein BGY98DRAFT_98795 [Russula aff. rugulosa BPL654]|nr:hypothetical protein BGY98DRAFT_98795 [Russula aff. rugulosa BPL654]